MPVVRYFLFTGAILLGLLFWSDWYFPNVVTETAASDIDRSVIRITSRHRWPAPVRFDTGVPLPRIATVGIAEADVPSPPRSMEQAYAYDAPAAAKAPDRARRRAKTVSRFSKRETQLRLASYQSNGFPAAW